MLQVIFGFILDFMIGDPFGRWHPICGIGNLIVFLRQKIRRLFPKNKTGELIGGIFLVLLTVLISSIIPLFILYISYKINYYFGFLIETIMCYQILATKSLYNESMKVYNAFCKEDVEKARNAVSMIVGRDTKELTKEGIIKATVETVAENTTDGVIAPLFYMVIGGPIFGFFYKAVNTLDSMVGYKNDEYIYFGKMSAKFDDILNFIPARISALFIILASFLCRLDWKNAWKIFKRDRYNHKSPNAAQTESACAGALNVMLAGDAYYFGKLCEKETIGDNNREIEPEDIKKVNKLMIVTAIIGMIILGCIRVLIGNITYY